MGGFLDRAREWHRMILDKDLRSMEPDGRFFLWMMKRDPRRHAKMLARVMIIEEDDPARLTHPRTRRDQDVMEWMMDINDRCQEQAFMALLCED